MFGFNKEEKESDRISKSWEKVKTSFSPYIPSQLFESEKHGTEGMLFGLTNIYPVIRFMCLDLQTTLFNKRLLAGEELIQFFSSLDEKVVIEVLKSWRSKHIPFIVDAILKKEGIFGKKTAVEELRRQQLLISLSKDQNLLIKRADMQIKFMPNYVRRAINAKIEEVLSLELSRTSNTSNNA